MWMYCPSDKVIANRKGDLFAMIKNVFPKKMFYSLFFIILDIAIVVVSR